MRRILTTLFVVITILLLASVAYADLGGWQVENNQLVYYTVYYSYYPDLNKRASGILTVNGLEYEFTDNGVLIGNGKVQKIAWFKNMYYYYYVDDDNYLLTGWQTVDGKKYYFWDTGSTIYGKAMTDGDHIIDSEHYYFDESGVMQTGFEKIKDKTYYYDSDGKRASGWITLDDKKYYFSTDSDSLGEMVVGTKEIDEEWYCFDESGVMQTGLVGEKYYGTDGKQEYGWKTVDGKKYYFDENKIGKYVTGKKTIDGAIYVFDDDGVMQKGPMHTLTINYQSEFGLYLKKSYIEEIVEGTEYSIESPDIDGYAADPTVVKGTMGELDVTVKVVYTVIPKPIPTQIQYKKVTCYGSFEMTVPTTFQLYKNKGFIDNELDVGISIEMTVDREYTYDDIVAIIKSSNEEFREYTNDNGVKFIINKNNQYVASVKNENKNRLVVISFSDTYGNKEQIFKDIIESITLLYPLEPADKVEAFVSRCYRLILNRDADEGGLKAWSAALKNKEAAAANIIDGFVKSDEFNNRNLANGDKVDILYKTMLNREADAGGKAGWVDALGQGYTLQNIIDGFCGSPEFINICKEYGIEPGKVGASTPTDTSTPRGKIEAFVKRCYKLILSRDADEGGLKGWSDALETRTAAAAQIIDGFVRSEEYINRNLSAGESVDILYKTMLDREADAGGRAGWVDALGQGFTLQHIINGFCGSAEFTAICDNYGIVAGSVSVQGALAKREAIAPEGEEEAAAIVVIQSEYTNEEKIHTFVEHCYMSVFDREGDAEGVENYTKAMLEGKKTPKKVAYEFIFSPEFQNNLPGNEAFIQILYKLYFNREADAEGLAGWVQMLKDGATLEEIVNGFASSAEFKTIVNEMKE